jgi:acetoin utilization protein AcuC
VSLGKQPVFVSNPIYHAKGYPPGHPLAIGRIGPVTDLCRILGWLDEGNYAESVMADEALLTRFHAPDYVAAVKTVSATGRATREERETYALGTMENPVFTGLFERASSSVGGSVMAARMALAGHLAYHPAGGTHHGRRDRASGFCYFNDPVFAILTLLDGGLTRVAYVDLDAHHGDGVEDAFAGDARVTCISVHEEKRWPGTGQGHGAHARNFPVPRGFSDSQLAGVMAEGVLPALQAFAPEAVVITCGADGLAGDPLSGMMLSNDALWDAVMQMVNAAPRAVVLGGGGYNPWTTVRCWVGLWARLNGFAIPHRLPDEATKILSALTCDLVDDDEMNPAWLTTLSDADAAEETCN